MSKSNLNDLRAFIMIASTQNSFTKAAAQMGVSQSALSHSIRNLEKRLNIKLFNRDTRNVSLTPAGENLFHRISPIIEDIDNEIAKLNDWHNVESGTLRLSGSEHVFNHVLWQKLNQFMQKHPHIQLELIADTRPVDIVAERFDAGIRMGANVNTQLYQHVRVSDEVRMCVVGSPNYLAQYGTPQTPNDLWQHSCMTLHVLSSNKLLNWEFSDAASPQSIIQIQPSGRFVASQTALLRRAALNHMGLTWLPRDTVEDDLQSGCLKTVLDDWAIHYAPYYLYFTQHRKPTVALQLLIDVLQQPE